MAYINSYYVFVETEDVSRGVEVTSHPVESGLDLTDNVKRSPVSISINGEIVGEDAATVLGALTSLHQSGKYIRYSGRNILNNAIIETFNTGHPNTITGGCSFSMTLKEIRVAGSPSGYSARKPTKNGTQQVQNNTQQKSYKVKKGDTLWAIAVSFYGSGAQYAKIYEANKDQIPNPKSLTVGTVLVIP